MVYEIVGKVDEVCAVQSFKSGFQKRDIVVNVQDEKSKYPNLVKFTASKDGCAALNSISRGSEVKIKFAVNGHVWDSPKGRQVFNDLKIVKIDVVGQSSSAPAPAQHQEDDGIPPEDDGMPF